MVALAWYSSSTSAFCGGSIIDEEYVLTAAHCAAVMDGSEVVVIGEHIWSSDNESTVRETVNIAQIISHPDYTSSTMQNDVALLKLAQPLNFAGDNKIAPICPPEAGNLYSSIDATVTGWGTIRSGGSLSDTLLEVTVPTMANSDCQDNYAQYGSDEITDDMICAGLPEGGKDSCQGDSGGPMISQDSSNFYRQIGVVSWGYGCARPGLPGVYARVTSQLNWISSQMPGSSWCSPGESPVTPAPTEAPVTPAPTETPTGDCSCGRVNRATRIVGGVSTEVNEYPWMVALAFSASSSYAFCGGSIIHERFVLTAAHCVAIMDGSEVVVIGEHTWSDSNESTIKETVTIEEIIRNQDYNPSTMENDMALLKLSRPLTFGSNNKVAPVCPPESGKLYSNINAIVTGWGTTESGGSISDTLLEVIVPTMPNSDCQDNYDVYGSDEITDDMICAGLPEGGKDSCQGDSGGPMVTQDSSFYRQIGVVSWGYGCAHAGLPGVYARVTSQLSWISSKMSEYTWCSPGGVPVTPVTTVAPATPTPTEPSVTSTPGECSCGRVNRGTRIVGGVPTEVNEYPWMVALAWYSSSTSAFCGGSIIDEEYVLTAAHCAAVMDGSEVVIIGEHIWSSDNESTVREIVNIAQIIRHPDYKSSTMQNDVALLRLAQPLTFGGDNKIAPICPPEAGNLYSSIDATVTGWGTISSGGSLSDSLLEVTVPTMPNSNCQDNYDVYGSDEITDDMICAGLPEGGKDSCQGDSGGPMISQDSSDFYRQIGVVSWGYGCASPGLPGVYARVTRQLNWISSQM
ncbi:unnamed protein product, partial [Meganyctiphanes norvegica]